MGFNAFSPMFGAGPQRGRLPPLFYWLLGDGRGHEEEEARWKVIIGRRKEGKGTFWQREPRKLLAVSLCRFCQLEASCTYQKNIGRRQLKSA